MLATTTFATFASSSAFLLKNKHSFMRRKNITPAKLRSGYTPHRGDGEVAAPGVLEVTIGMELQAK